MRVRLEAGRVPSGRSLRPLPPSPTPGEAPTNRISLRCIRRALFLSLPSLSASVPDGAAWPSPLGITPCGRGCLSPGRKKPSWVAYTSVPALLSLPEEEMACFGGTHRKQYVNFAFASDFECLVLINVQSEERDFFCCFLIATFVMLRRPSYISELSPEKTND